MPWLRVLRLILSSLPSCLIPLGIKDTSLSSIHFFDLNVTLGWEFGQKHSMISTVVPCIRLITCLFVHFLATISSQVFSTDLKLPIKTQKSQSRLSSRHKKSFQSKKLFARVVLASNFCRPDNSNNYSPVNYNTSCNLSNFHPPSSQPLLLSARLFRIKSFKNDQSRHEAHSRSCQVHFFQTGRVAWGRD